MGAPYAGANTFPSTILCPDDGDSRQASSQNIPDQGLADRTVYNKLAIEGEIAGRSALLNQIPAINFFVGAAVVFGHLAYNPVRRAWIGVGIAANARALRASTDGGQTFAADEIAGMTGTIPAIRVAVDSAGNMVATTSSSVAYEFSAGTWTYRSGFAGAAPDVGAAYELAHDGTYWVGYLACAGARAYRWSADRATWASRTALSSSATNTFGRVAAKPGLIVSCGIPSTATTTTEFLATTDGGATFVGSTFQTVNHGLVVVQQSLQYDPLSGLFVFAVASSGACKLYTSSDGTTWTLVATLGGGGRIQRIAFLGSMWLAQMGTQSLALSLDRGVTWRYTGYVADSAVTTLASAGAGQFAMASGTLVYPSLRTGGGLTLVT